MFRGAIKYVFTALVLALVVLADAKPASAQSDILLQLRSGSPAGDRFRVDSAGGFVALGQIGFGIIPASGAGWRLMWYPYKTAFRAGYADLGGQFDDSNIGFYSWAGGALPIASGNYSFAFGSQVTANGQGSFVIGQRASSNNFHGSFVFGDNSTSVGGANNGLVVTATANNQFAARASGGVIFYTNATATAGASLSPGGTSWNVVSDRNRKEGFLQVDGEEVLARLENVPVSRWRYISEENRAVSHIGPMAQDWHAAFGLSDDDLTINSGDFDGVNLAAIQALRVRTNDLRADADTRDARIATLEDRVADLEAQNAALEARLRRIEEALGTAE